MIDVVGKLEKDRSLLERRIKDETEQKVGIYCHSVQVSPNKFSQFFLL